MNKTRKFLTAKTDRVFKAILGDEDNPELLKEFLERIFKTKVEIIEFLQPEIKIETTDERVKTVDLLVKMNDKFVHIEMNSQNKDYLHNRNFIYFTSIFNKKTKRGKQYDTTTEFIHIDFTYGLNDKEDYREYYIMDNKGKKYIENLKIIEYNMNKITNYFKNDNEKMIQKYKHLIMLNLDRNDLKELSKGDAFVEKFDEKLEELNERETYEPALTYEEDLEYCLNTEKAIARKKGREEGLKEGIKEGKEEGLKKGISESKKEIAKNLLEDNIDMSLISKYTGLSVEEIKKLNV